MRHTCFGIGSGCKTFSPSSHSRASLNSKNSRALASLPRSSCNIGPTFTRVLPRSTSRHTAGSGGHAFCNSNSSRVLSCLTRVVLSEVFSFPSICTACTRSACSGSIVSVALRRSLRRSWYRGQRWIILKSQSRRPRLLQVGSVSRILSQVPNSLALAECAARTSSVVPNDATKAV